jgi:hypothetical protein
VGLGSLPSSIVKVSAFDTNSGSTSVNIRVTKPWNFPGGGTATGSMGYCDFDSFGKLVKIDTLAYSAQSPSDFQDFGEIPSVGRFIVILREARYITGGNAAKSPTKIYHSTIGKDSEGETSVFPVLVNDKQLWWWADCNERYIGQLSTDRMRVLPLARNSSTLAINKLVCAR